MTFLPVYFAIHDRTSSYWEMDRFHHRFLAIWSAQYYHWPCETRISYVYIAVALSGYQITPLEYFRPETFCKRKEVLRKIIFGMKTMNHNADDENRNYWNFFSFDCVLHLFEPYYHINKVQTTVYFYHLFINGCRQKQNIAYVITWAMFCFCSQPFI